MTDAEKLEKYRELAATVNYSLPVLNMLSKMLSNTSPEDATCTENMAAGHRILELIADDLKKAYRKLSE
jgi:hypothetical protein